MGERYRYFLAFSLPVVTFLAIFNGGYWSFATVVEAFLIIPLLELLVSPDKSGPTNASEETALSADRFYDLLLYFMVPVHYSVLAYFIYRVGFTQLTQIEYVGMILSMGIQCGSIGINVAHELGHRKSKLERFLARCLLLSSLYMHFIVEHNRGHHKNVGTPQDPASARLNEPVYTFWVRTIFGSFISAWNIERNERRKKDLRVWSLGNEMIRLVILESLFVGLIYFTAGMNAMIAFLIASLIGIILLETVNYIEHYGLRRRQLSDGKFEKIQPWHSWNSDYPLGRIILFELTRHSDHHYKASKKYQVLRHLEQSPQLPTGYPGMMLLSLFPPLWFRVVNPLIAEINQQQR